MRLGIGDDAARRREMIGDRGTQRRQAGRIAILGETGRAAMGEIGLQQPPPGLERKQLGTGAARKEIEQQPVAGDVRAHGRRAPCRSGIGMRVCNAIVASEAGCRRGMRRQLFGDINSRRRPRFDDAFDQQQVVGANHGVARDRQLLGELPRRRQPRARPDPRAADRLADLVDHLRRQRLRPGPIEEDGNLHVSPRRLAFRVAATEQGLGQLWVQCVESWRKCAGIVSCFIARCRTGSFGLPATGPIAPRPVSMAAQRPSRSAARNACASVYLLGNRRNLRAGFGVWLMEPSHFPPVALGVPVCLPASVVALTDAAGARRDAPEHPNPKENL